MATEGDATAGTRRKRADCRINRRGVRRPIKLKRVCEKPEEADGLRVLVDRLWPRGLSQGQVAADLWLREVAPSNTLLRWFGHDPRRWSQFQQKYRAQLAQQPELLHTLDDLRRRTPITLLFGAHDEARNNAVVLRDILDARGGSPMKMGDSDAAETPSN
ncbi:MAG: DUF488 family protein [Betaproteobacteria bacterium]|nr:DUF488 family protein [Betaproteobacteria bacterium]